MALSPASVFGKPSAKMLEVRLGSYSKYSRIVFGLDRSVDYRVIPEREKGIIKVIFKNTVIEKSGFEGKRFSDARLKSIHFLEPSETDAEVTINYRFHRDAFFYFSLKNPPRIVIDVKKREQAVQLAGEKGPSEKKMADVEKLDKDDGFIKIYSSKKDKGSQTIESAEESGHIDGGTVEEVKDKRIFKPAEPAERKMYKDALRLYQKHRYSEAIGVFEDIRSMFPEGRYAEEALFLIADAYDSTAKESGETSDYFIAVEAYKQAVRDYPDSERSAYAQYKTGKIYLKVEFFVEAKVAFDLVIKNYPQSEYKQGARFGNAEILLVDRSYTGAYNEFIRGVSIKPDSKASRDATFLLARSFFDQKDYIISQKLYEDGMVKWADYVMGNPDILLGMGTSFLKNERFTEAKRTLFDLVNLHPDTELSESALLMIGSYYRKIGDHKDSLKVYIETLARRPESDQAITGKLKMANVGIDRPGIKSKTNIFNYKPYLEPLVTYQKIAKKFSGKPVAGEALFQKGVALFKGSRYIDAVLTLKEMITQYPNSPFAERGLFHLKDILLKLIDSYYSQDGYFPVILTYHNNADPFLEDITEKRILYKIGKSYQKLAIYDLAEKSYKKLKKIDKGRRYRERIGLRMAEIRIAKGEYAEAEQSLRRLLSAYPRSKHYLDADQLYAYSLYKQKKFGKSSVEYAKILKKAPQIPNASEIYYYLASSFYGKEDYKAAENAFTKAIKRYRPAKGEDDIPDYISDSYFYKGDSLYNSKKYSSAITALTAALKYFPENEWLQYLIGKSYEKMKKEEKAKDIFKEVASATGLLASVAEADVRNMEWFDKNRKDFSAKY